MKRQMMKQKSSFYHRIFGVTVMMLLTIFVAISGQAAGRMQIASSLQGEVATASSDCIQRDIHAAIDSVDKTEVRASRLPEGVEIITESPAGQVVKCRRAASGIYPLAIYVVSFDQTQITAEMVYGEDGNVYIKDILTYYKKGTYVRGTVEGSVLTVPLGQYLSYNEETGKGLRLVKYIPVLDEDGYVEDFLIDEDASSVKYNIGTDGSIELEEGTVLGSEWSDSGQVAWYCDVTQGNYPFNLEPSVKPETVCVDNWALIHDGKGCFVPVGIDGSDIYIGGLCPDLPEAWLKGKINGNSVVFDSDQYLGECFDCYQYLCFGKETTNGEGGVTTDFIHGPVTFGYDADKREITPAQDVVMIVNGELDRDFALLKYHNPVIYYPDYKPVVPLNPELVIVSPFDSEAGYGYIVFDLPNVDTDGRMIDVGSYCYNIYIDGNVYTLRSALYHGLPSDEMTDIPYTFNDRVYRDIVADNERHEFVFFAPDLRTIGVQGVYTVDNMTNKTGIVTCNIETGDISVISGIDRVEDEMAHPVGYELYNLSGVLVNCPERGRIYLQKVRYSDGSVKTFKRVAR